MCSHTPLPTTKASQSAPSASSCSCSGTAKGQCPPLDNLTNNVSARRKPLTISTGESLYSLQQTAAKVSGGRVAKCGCQLAPNAGTVGLVKKDERCHYSGLYRCGSIWLCPSCALKVAEHRAGEIAAITDAIFSKGGTAGMATFTRPHHKGQSAKQVTESVIACWRKVKQRRAYDDLMQDWPEYEGDVRRLEVTYGDNGWHPHLHVLFFSFSKPEVHAEKVNALFAIWKQVVEKEGFGTCSVKAFDYTAVRDAQGVAEYVSKWNVAREVSDSGMFKQAKGKGRNPFQILADIEAGTNVAVDTQLYSEYSAAFKRKRQLTWSRDLRKKWLGAIYDEMTDEQIAQREEPGEEVMRITPAVWAQMLAANLIIAFRNLAALEGEDHAVNFLNRSGIRCELVPSIDYDTGEITANFLEPVGTG